MIEAKELRKVYKTKKGVVVNALDGVSVKLPDTGMVFILGKSGSGKSTLLNVLGGLDSYDSGEIFIKGKSAKAFKQRHYDSYRNTYIGFIFQEYNILEELTVGANIALAIELQGRRANNEEVNAILEEVDLGGLGQRKPNELSGGQKQRVAIARALVKKPEIIMADEPTGALDSATGKQVFDTLKKLSRDKLVLIVSHDREFSEQYADRIIELKDGKIISDVERKAEQENKYEIDDPLVWGESEIGVRAGYELTEEDRLAINEYLRAHAEGVVIKPRGEGRRVSSKDFAPTDETAIISEKRDGFKLIKSKLSIKNAFKLGSGALKYKKFRLVVTIFLSLIAFTLFGLADTIAAYNDIDTTASSIYDTGVEYAAFVKQVKMGNDNYSYWSRAGGISEKDLETISREANTGFIGVYSGEYNLNFNDALGNIEEDGKEWSRIYTSNISGFVGLDQATLDMFDFELEGRLPQNNANEIVITKYSYEYFTKRGYELVTEEGIEVIDITQPSDLIGKTVRLEVAFDDNYNYEIVGIVDTHFDLSRYEILADENATMGMNMLELMMTQLELESAQNYSFASVCFVHPNFINNIIKKNENAATELSGIGSISFYKLVDDTDIEKEGIRYDIDGENNVINSNYYSYMNTLDNVRDYVIWTGDELSTLKQNQIIIPVEIAKTMAITSGNQVWGEVMHNRDLLIGVEKQMVDKSDKLGIYIDGLYSILVNIRDYAKIAYYFNNSESAKNMAKAYYMYEQYDATESDFLKLDEYDVFWHYMNAVEWDNEYKNQINVDSYLNGLCSRYSLIESYLLTEAQKSALVTSYVYNGVTYYSYPKDELKLTFKFDNNYRDLLRNSYSATYFEDAAAFYKLYNGLPEDYVIPSNYHVDVLSMYASYVSGELYNESVEGFTPKNNVTVEEYEGLYISKLLKASNDEYKSILSVYSYLNYITNYIRDIEIVGIIGNDAPDVRYNNNSRIVVNSEVYEMVYGFSDVAGIFDFALGKMPDNEADIRENMVRFSKRFTLSDGKVRYNLTNNVTDQIDMVEEILNILGKVFFYVGLGFALFASIMLANFITTSITHKKQDIGILRAIGSRSNDVFRIFFAESFIIAMINYVLSLSATFAVTMVLNNILRQEAGLLITFLNFGIRQVLVLFAVSIGVAFIATFLPVRKIAAMKPIDAIKNRK